MVTDTGGLAAIIGSCAAALLAYNQYRQKVRTDDLESALRALKAAQDEAGVWREKYERVDGENKALQAQITALTEKVRELTSFVMFEKIPPAMQSAVDHITATLDKMDHTMETMLTYVRSETGKVE